MRKNRKEKMIDFFYNEIEVEDNSSSKEKQSNGPDKHDKPASVPDNSPSVKRPIDTKIKYQYPKHQPALFQLPTDSKQTAPAHKQRNVSHEMVQQRLREKHASARTRTAKSSPIQPRKRMNDKQLEDTPAFLRRNHEQKRHKEQQEISRQNEQAEKNQLETELTADPTPSLADLTDVEPTRP